MSIINGLSISSMKSPRSGLPVPNQFLIIDTETGTKYFQSYETLIAVMDGETSEITLSSQWDCSVTTLRYLKEFLETPWTTKRDIELAIEQGDIKVVSDLHI